MTERARSRPVGRGQGCQCHHERARAFGGVYRDFFERYGGDVVRVPAVLKYSPSYACAFGGVALTEQLPIYTYVGIRARASGEASTFEDIQEFSRDGAEFRRLRSEELEWPALMAEFLDRSWQFRAGGPYERADRRGIVIGLLTETEFKRGWNVAYAAALGIALLLLRERRGAGLTNEVLDALGADLAGCDPLRPEVTRLAWTLASAGLRVLASGLYFPAMLSRARRPLVIEQTPDPVLPDAYDVNGWRVDDAERAKGSVAYRPLAMDVRALPLEEVFPGGDCETTKWPFEFAILRADVTTHRHLYETYRRVVTRFTYARAARGLAAETLRLSTPPASGAEFFSGAVRLSFETLLALRNFYREHDSSELLDHMALHAAQLERIEGGLDPILAALISEIHLRTRRSDEFVAARPLCHGWSSDLLLAGTSSSLERLLRDPLDSWGERRVEVVYASCCRHHEHARANGAGFVTAGDLPALPTPPRAHSTSPAQTPAARRATLYRSDGERLRAVGACAWDEAVEARWRESAACRVEDERGDVREEKAWMLVRDEDEGDAVVVLDLGDAGSIKECRDFSMAKATLARLLVAALNGGIPLGRATSVRAIGAPFAKDAERSYWKKPGNLNKVLLSVALPESLKGFRLLLPAEGKLTIELPSGLSLLVVRVVPAAAADAGGAPS